MSWPRPIRIVGIGSNQGDDAMAWNVVRQWQKRQNHQGLDFFCLEGGQRLLDILDGGGSLVLIDAFAPAGNPGAIQRIDFPDDRLSSLRPSSTHDMNLAETLSLAATLGLLPSKVVVWGIEGEDFAPASTLSPAVAEAIPTLVQQMASDLCNEESRHA